MLFVVFIVMALGESRRLLASEIKEICDENPWDKICKHLKSPVVVAPVPDTALPPTLDKDEDPYAGIENQLDNTESVADFYSGLVDNFQPSARRIKQEIKHIPTNDSKS